MYPDSGFGYAATALTVTSDSIMELSFMTDVALNFITTYLDPHTKEECIKPRRIRMRYLKTWFVPDVVRCANALPWIDGQ